MLLPVAKKLIVLFFDVQFYIFMSVMNSLKSLDFSIIFTYKFTLIGNFPDKSKVTLIFMITKNIIELKS